MWELLGHPPGVFLDVGAGDGFVLSNTCLLQSVGWTGVLVEPNPAYRERLAARHCPIVDKCAWDISGAKLELRSVPSFLELSKLDAVTQLDHLDTAGQRDAFELCPVESITIPDIAQEHHLPAVIDYLSIDIEGAELTALKAIDFDTLSFRLITVEHNFTSARDEICELLQRAGFRRKWTELSGWDDWYVNDAAMEAPMPTHQPPLHRLATLWRDAGNTAQADVVDAAIVSLWEAGQSD